MRMIFERKGQRSFEKNSHKQQRYLQKIVVFVCSLLLLTGSFGLPVYAEDAVEEPGQLYALSACLLDAENGRVLFQKEGDVKRANASTTKILTLIVTLENGDFSDIVTVSARAARQPDVQLNIKEGERYRLEDLCYSLMLESHNDVAVAIAEHVGGSVEGFAALMNDKAKEIGCVQSYFITPNGLDAEDEEGFHGTTAEELAKIMAYCIKRSPQSEQFLKITRTESYTFTDAEKTRHFTCQNHNAFLHMMEGVLSGKTGFTSDAGYCYVGALERDGCTFIVALLGCGWPGNKTYKWKDCKTLFSYGLENYSYEIFTHTPRRWECGLPNGASPDGNPYVVPVVTFSEEPMEPIGVILRKDEQIVFEEQLELATKAPVIAGQNYGSVSYYLEQADNKRVLLQKTEVLANTGVEEKNYLFCLRYLVKKIFY